MFSGLEHIIYQPGVKIFKEGDEGDCAYLIESGCVDISTRKKKKFFRITILGKGELFGEVALIDGDVRTATATAIEETRLVRIGRDLIEAEIAKGSPIIEYLLRLVLKRFRHVHDRLTGHDRFVPVGIDNKRDQALSETQQNLIEHIRIATDISEALKQDQFKLYYQPIISIKDGRLVGFEALIRWFHPENGLIQPVEFLNVAENTDQIVPIGIWTLEQACRDIKIISKKSQNASGETPLYISINVSARQLIKAKDTAQFINILHSTGLDIAHIKLEITETILIEEPKYAQQILTELRDLGFQISLDDFGTGYSSLSHLQRFPVASIKIDRSFISRMLTDDCSMQIVKGSIDLARSMGLGIVSEGVEFKEEVDKLIKMNCPYAQGYFFSKPLPLQKAIEYSRQHHRKNQKIRTELSELTPEELQFNQDNNTRRYF